MKRRRAVSASFLVALAVALPGLASSPAHAQVNADWLRMWKQAQTHRPARLGPEARIAPAGEPGTPLVVDDRQWSDSLRFADDPLLSKQEKAAAGADGRFGSIRPVRTEDGVVHVRYTVRLKPGADF